MASTDWLRKPRNIKAFSAASVVILASGMLVSAILVLPSRGALPLLEASTLFRTFCGLVGVLAAPAGIYLALGMVWYWAKLDPSPRFYKTLWFLLFLATSFFGLAIYSLFVYRRQATNQTVVRSP